MPTLRFDGQRNLTRRDMVERGEQVNFNLNGIQFDIGFAKWTKTVPTYAVMIPYDFEVETLEGLHSAHAGDYLAIGQAGEMYPIAKDVFENTYKLVRDDG